MVLFAFFVFLLVLLSRLALQSNQASNSKASETEKNIQLIPTAKAPSLTQQTAENSFSASRDSSGYLELSGTPPKIEENRTYSLYMKKDGIFSHMETFIATQQNVNEKFSSFWKPAVNVSDDDVQKSIFILFKVK